MKKATAETASNAEINADRFVGFADVYEENRPAVPERCIQIITDYLGKVPDTVVDFGCGTGLSTQAWQGKCSGIIGIEPSGDMLDIAKLKQLQNAEFIQAYAHDTGLTDESADVVVCSQSFHWMAPEDTLKEVNRILKPNGVFAAVDYDLPPVFDWQIESVYCKLFDKVRAIESENKVISDTFNRWDKNRHLKNIKSSGYFRFAREIVFESFCAYDVNKFIGLALSQGSLQTILREQPLLIEKDVLYFEKVTRQYFGNKTRNISFCYRMRIGIK